MNTYLRALKHIDMSDVKQKHHQKLIENEIRKENEKKYLKELTFKNSPEFSNWRNEISEQMTTTDVFYSTLPATGDVDLANPPWNILDGQGYSVSGGTLTIGDGQVNDGAVASFDSSFYSNLVFDTSISGSSIFGVFISGVDDPLVLSSSSGTYSINVNQSKNLVLLFLASGVSGSVSISNLRFQRRTPISVFVPLDNPEASSFIRSDPMFANLSPEERNKKLKEMIESGDEYLNKMFGTNFPGTGAVPPGEYDPFAQTPPGEAGDTPGVEIAGYGLRPDGTSGMNKVGDKVYDPATKKQYELVPSPKYGGGNEWQPVRQAIDSSQYTQIAQALPIEPAQQRKGTTGVGLPRNFPTGPTDMSPSKMNYPKEWLPKQAQKKQTAMVAHYEPEGQLISEKKLKSPEEILNKIPGYYTGKPAPLGFPETPPPKMKNGMHPDLVDGKKVADRFNRLDPESAKAMPLTDNPHVDKKVKAARKKPK